VHDKMKWFRDARFGMFIHWGLYSMLGGHYNGKETPDAVGEWIMRHMRIPLAEYKKLAGSFDPVRWDAEAVVRLCRDSGMKYLTFTTKHHDGFAMFHSRVDKYNVVDATPFGRDVIGELAEACAKYGLRIGFYYSQDLDWHEKHGGGYLSEPVKCAGVTWENSWDFPDKSEKNYAICFENKILPQVEELMRKEEFGTEGGATHLASKAGEEATNG